MPDSNLKRAVQLQREKLTQMLGPRMQQLAGQLAPAMHQRERLEQLMAEALPALSDCKQLFVLDADFQQVVSNITRGGADDSSFGRDRRGRPYIRGLIGSTDFKLSEAYISRNRNIPMLTAVQVIRNEERRLLGFLGVDYDLGDLPATQSLYRQSDNWRQIKGDPAIRGGLFAQQRAQSAMDDHIDEVLSVLTELMIKHGVFHGKLHFSSSRATVWMADDPLSYRLLDVEELTSPDICLAHPLRAYPDCAVVPETRINPVLQMFKQLRFVDETIYLRSGSLNLCNGLVSLNFSCDGTHYLRFEEFLDKGMDLWHGGAE